MLLCVVGNCRTLVLKCGRTLMYQEIESLKYLREKRRNDSASQNGWEWRTGRLHLTDQFTLVL